MLLHIISFIVIVQTAFDVTCEKLYSTSVNATWDGTKGLLPHLEILPNIKIT